MPEYKLAALTSDKNLLVALARGGFLTTSHLLSAAKKSPDAVDLLAESLGQSSSKLAALVARCELVQINGIGPIAATALRDSSIADLAALRNAPLERLVGIRVHGRALGVRRSNRLQELARKTPLSAWREDDLAAFTRAERKGALMLALVLGVAAVVVLLFVAGTSLLSGVLRVAVQLELPESSAVEEAAGALSDARIAGMLYMMFMTGALLVTAIPLQLGVFWLKRKLASQLIRRHGPESASVFRFFSAKDALIGRRLALRAVPVVALLFALGLLWVGLPTESQGSGADLVAFVHRFAVSPGYLEMLAFMAVVLILFLGLGIVPWYSQVRVYQGALQEVVVPAVHANAISMVSLVCFTAAWLFGGTELVLAASRCISQQLVFPAAAAADALLPDASLVLDMGSLGASNVVEHFVRVQQYFSAAYGAVQILGVLFVNSILIAGAVLHLAVLRLCGQRLRTVVATVLLTLIGLLAPLLLGMALSSNLVGWKPGWTMSMGCLLLGFLLSQSTSGGLLRQQGDAGGATGQPKP